VVRVYTKKLILLSALSHHRHLAADGTIGFDKQKTEME
jgi:hypothetical protein